MTRYGLTARDLRPFLAADGRGVVAAVDTYASTDYGGVFHDGALWAFDALGHLRWRRDFEAPGISGTFGVIAGVATSDDTVYVASRDRLERWPR